MRSRVIAVIALLSLSTLVLAEAPGESLFKKNCAMCHGADGTGKTGMGVKLGAANLASSDVQSLSDAAIAQTIRNGKGKMPPFEKSLTPDEIDQLVHYVRRLHK